MINNKYHIQYDFMLCFDYHIPCRFPAAQIRKDTEPDLSPPVAVFCARPHILCLSQLQTPLDTGCVRERQERAWLSGRGKPRVMLPENA
ncbi:hypothetical protein EpCFBP13511_23425 [Erwinia persicina]|uniref:Uncharacterized protein n=1 Tax=Erwinia persicina TaxID=55211 RepID=A0A4U3ERX3_9GAMM|nr:hypothetical protein EpCFBP13511_23425 [Erwinia persicina]